jgi:predicted RecA/RadA family phage recombinase
MKNYIQPGNTVTLIAPSGGVKAGDPILVGSLFGVAATDAAEAAEVEVSLVGVFDLPSAGAINAGAAVYWDAVASKITATATAHPLVGVALLAVGSGGTVCRVRLGFAAMAPAA